MDECSAPSLAFDDHGADFGFGDQNVANHGPRLVPAHGIAATDLLDVVFEHIAGARRLAELRLVYGDHVDERPAVVLVGMNGDGTGSLRHTLDDQDARENWVAGEMPLEHRLVGADVLDAHG